MWTALYGTDKIPFERISLSTLSLPLSHTHTHLSSPFPSFIRIPSFIRESFKRFTIQFILIFAFCFSSPLFSYASFVAVFFVFFCIPNNRFFDCEKKFIGKFEMHTEKKSKI